MRKARCRCWPASRHCSGFEQWAKGGSARYHKFEVNDAAMDRVFLDNYIAAHHQAAKQITLDADVTDIPLHGDQEGRSFMATRQKTATCRFMCSQGNICCWRACCRGAR